MIDLPGATPIDFAYRVHTDLGHRCRGAKVNGQLVTSTRPSRTARRWRSCPPRGGPSRDWLNPHQGYVVTPRARQKIKQYFSALEEEELLVRGRSVLVKGDPARRPRPRSIDDLATRLGFKNAEACSSPPGAARWAAGDPGRPARCRGRSSRRAPRPRSPSATATRRRRRHDPDRRRRQADDLPRPLLQMAPPDAIQGYVTRGRVRVDPPGRVPRLPAARPQAPRAPRQCPVGRGAAAPRMRLPGGHPGPGDGPPGPAAGHLRGAVREKLNVIAVNTLSRKGAARMRFTIEVQGVQQIQRACSWSARSRASPTSSGAEGDDRPAADGPASLCVAVHRRGGVLIALKTLAWWITGSVGLLSDALESLVNNLAGASFALWMILVTRAPPDRLHPFGHGKAEYFSSGFEGILILGAALAIIWAAERLLAPAPRVAGWGLAWSAAPPPSTSPSRGCSPRPAAVQLHRPAGRLPPPDDRRVDLRRRDRRRGAGGLDRLAAPRPLIAIAVGLNITREAWHPAAQIGGWPDGPQPRPRRHRRAGACWRRFKPRGVAFEGLRTRRAGPPPSCRWWCGCPATGRCATATPCSTRSRPRWWPAARRRGDDPPRALA